MSSNHVVASPDAECLPKCRSVIHGSKVVSVLTKRSGIDLLVYIRYICSNYVHVTDKLGRNALHMAASNGQTKVIEWLLTKDHCDPNVKDYESGWTSLHRSLFYGQLTAAKLLIENGANLLVNDNEGHSPMDIIIRDRLPYVEYSLNCPCDVYVWGSNNNFNLGHEKHQSRSTPETVELFKREKLSIKQVVMCKYHTVFLTSDGKVFTCGHGHGGRLGHDDELTTLSPKQIKTLCMEECIQIAAATDHTAFLTRNGSVWTCGMNLYHQLGHYPAPERLLSPRMIRSLKGCPITGIVTSRFHTVVYNRDSLYTFGLNGGQLGHLKGDKTEINPRQVSAINLKETKLHAVCASDGATICVTDRGDIFVLNNYLCRKIISKQTSVLSIASIGGQLDLKSHRDLLKDNGGEELKIVILNKTGHIYIWQESSAHLTRCLFSTRHQLFVNSFSLSASSLVFLTNDGEGYLGTFLPRCNKSLLPGSGDNSLPSTKKEKRSSKEESFAGSGDSKTREIGGRAGQSSNKSLVELIDKDACEKIEIERLPGIHRAIASTCDSKGKNFAVIQATPSTGILESPGVCSSAFVLHMSELLSSVDIFDNIHDVVLQVGNIQFPAHKYILACRSDYFSKLFLSKLTNNSKTNDGAILIDDVQPVIFIQLLKFIYTNLCDYLQLGYRLPVTLYHRPNKENDERKEYTNTSHKRKISKVEESNKKIVNDFIEQVQAAACKFGLQALATKMESIQISDGVVVGVSVSNKVMTFNRKKHSHLHDVGIICEDGMKLNCHKCILVSRLEYFHGMFANEWIEANLSDSLNLPFPSSVLELMIDYLYTDDAPRLLKCEDADFLCKSLLVCDHLLIDRLKEMCECALAQLITLKNATEFLEFAYLCKAKQLQAICMEFICVNLPAIIDNKSLSLLSEEVLDLLSINYRNMIPAMQYRHLTPYADAPSDEEVKAIVESQPPLTPDDLESADQKLISSNSTRKQKAKNKPRIHRNSQSRTSPTFKSPDSSECEVSSPPVEDQLECQPVSEPIPTLNSDVSSPDTVFCATPTYSFDFDVVPWSAKQLSDGKDVGLKEIMVQQREQEHRKPPMKNKPSNEYKKTNKLSQKQRKKLSLTCNENDVEIPHPPTPDEVKLTPKPAWGVVDHEEVKSLSDIMKSEGQISCCLNSSPSVESKPKLVSSGDQSPTTNPWLRSPERCPKTNNKLKFADIVEDEQTKVANLKKVQTKPLHLIQIEEQAIEELTKYYSASENDEVISVHRVLPDIVAVPTWKATHK